MFKLEQVQVLLLIHLEEEHNMLMEMYVELQLELMIDDGTNIQSAIGTTAGILKVDLSATTANSTAVKVDGSAVTQPISGTIGVSNAFALDATLTGGTTKAICRGGAKGATTAADVTSTSQSVDRNALDVQIRTSSGVAVDTFGGGTQYADGDARGTATGTLLMIDDGTNIQSAIGTTAGVLKVDLSATTANATAVKVDGSAVTQPVSGTIGVSNAFALDATLTGGTAKSICRGGAKGATTAADVTSTSQSVDRNALDVQIRTSAGVAVD